MILESVEHGQLIWPTIKENGVIMTKKYEALSATEKFKVSKDLWERVQLLMQGTSLTKQERECKLLPSEWSKFVTDVKLSPLYGSIHPTQHFSTTYPSAPHAITYPSTPHPNAYSSTLHQDAYPQPQSIPQIKYNVSTVNQQTHLAEFPQIDFGLAEPVFKQIDDPIDAISKMMSFLSTVISSHFPTINNQLRNSSNPRQQATVHVGRVTVQLVQGKQRSFVVEGHMARQSPKPKRKREATWFRDKVLLVEAQGSDKVLNGEEFDFLADPEVAEAKAVLMANLSSYGSDVLSEENELLTKTFNVFKNESNEKEAKNIDKEIALEKKVKELDNIVCKMGPSTQFVHILTKPQVFYDNNLKEALGFQNPFYLKKAQQISPTLYDGSVIAKETNVISTADFEETLMLEEESRSKMLLKQSDPKVLEKKVNIKPINYAELN
nr:hypothetical protein [Tanacetum cinerariifolium]